MSYELFQEVVLALWKVRKICWSKWINNYKSLSFPRGIGTFHIPGNGFEMVQLPFLGGWGRRLATLACRWFIYQGTGRSLDLFSFQGIVTLSTNSQYNFELMTTAFWFDFFQFGRKRHFEGTRVKLASISRFYWNSLAETPFGIIFISKLVPFKLGLLLTGKKCICMTPSWLIVIFNNRITPMDVFEYECSNFTTDKWYIIVFQTPCSQNIHSWSKQCLTLKISIDRLNTSIR